jgi:Zn-dependent protease with chaperone function
MELKSARRETIWFAVNALLSLVILFLAIRFVLGLVQGGGMQVLFMYSALGIYILLLILYLFIAKGLMIGYLRGNGVRISEHQFPEVYEIYKKKVAELGLAREPAFYLVEAGGSLNAFATRMFFRDYVVMYSDLVEAAYEEGEKAVAFVIGHELAHIARGHLLKGALTFPMIILFPLRLAWMRACEYTCDEVGARLAGEGAETGLTILAAGKRLYRRIDVDRYSDEASREGGFWVWLAQVMSSHPHLPRRIRALRG